MRIIGIKSMIDYNLELDHDGGRIWLFFGHMYFQHLTLHLDFRILVCYRWFCGMDVTM